LGCGRVIAGGIFILLNADDGSILIDDGLPS